MLDRIMKNFPPPNYLLMPAIGIDISDLSLKYSMIKKTKNGIGISFFGKKEIPIDTVISGEIKRKDRLVEILKSIQKEIGEKNVVASLPEEKGFLVSMKLPNMKKEEVRGAIELQLEEKIPLSLNEVIFDFDIVEESNIDDGKHIDVNLVAFPKNIVQDYVDVFVEAGFIPVAFEVETQAFKRSIILNGDLETQMIIDFGKTRTTFAIIKDGKIYFTSTVGIAGRDIDNAIVKNLLVDKSEVEKIKKEMFFVRNSENEKFFNAILPVVSAISDEIKKQVLYWGGYIDEHGKKVNNITKVTLCGGEANLSGLTEYLSYDLKLPIKLANPFININSLNSVPEIGLKESLMYATSFGLSLRSFLNE